LSLSIQMNVTVVVAEKVLEFKVYLATVTCNRDFQEMLLQAESIGKFVEPCRHIIIINEPNPNIKFWYKWLTPYYKNHELIILPGYEDVSKTHKITGKKLMGWTTQQVQKLFIGMKHEFLDDYILLDSKNFFVKPTKLDDFAHLIGAGGLVEIKHPYEETNEYYAEMLGLTPFEKVFPVITPFVVKTKYLRKFWPNQVEDMMVHGVYTKGPKKGKEILVSEFLFYTYLVDKEELFALDNEYKRGLGRTIWDWSIDSLEHSLYQEDWNVYAIHREVIKKLYPSGFDFINTWLAEKGLTNKIRPRFIPS